MPTEVVPLDLGTKRIGSLLKDYAVPGIIAMTASSLYNMVDSIYIGHIKDVGAYAISGLAVSFPLMNLASAFGTLVGIGASTMISILLGQRDYEKARIVLANEITLNLIFGLLFSVVALSFLDPVLYFFGASEHTLPHARSYMSIILTGNVFTHLYLGLNSCIRSAGNPRLAMGLTIFTVLFNSVLDPILIFGFGMGIRGAAIATVISQILALTYTWRHLSKKENLLYFPRGFFRFTPKVAVQSLEIGLGPFLMNAAACLVALFINQQLRKYGGDLSIGAYGIVNRISFLFIMVVAGLNQGMQPIAGYNYGARLYSRVKEVYILTALWATLIMVLGFVFSEFLPKPTVSLFTNDPELKFMAVRAIRCMNLILPVIGFQMVTTNFFQSLGMVKVSITLSLSRQIILLLPLIYTLPHYIGVKGVWFSFPISDALSVVLAFSFLINLLRKLGRLNDGDEPSILGGRI